MWGELELDKSGLGQGKVWGFCEQGDVLSGKVSYAEIYWIAMELLASLDQTQWSGQDVREEWCGRLPGHVKTSFR